MFSNWKSALGSGLIFGAVAGLVSVVVFVVVFNQLTPLKEEPFYVECEPTFSLN